jgi:hypothetical protein
LSSHPIQQSCSLVLTSWRWVLLLYDPELTIWLRCWYEKGSLNSETVKYGHKSQGTGTRERLRCQGPAACTKDRPVLSSIAMWLWRNRVESSRMSSREVKSWVSRRQPDGIWTWEQTNWIESSLRNWQLQNNGKKLIRLWKQDFMCDFKLQGAGYKSVAGIRLGKTFNSSACATVKCEVCRSAIAL